MAGSVGVTNSSGVADAGPLTLPSGDVGGGYTITAYFGSSSVPLPPAPGSPPNNSYNASDPDYSASPPVSAGVTVVDPTQTSLAVSPNQSVFGQSVSLTATVAPASSAGTVAFFQGTSAISGCQAQPLQLGQATCPSPNLTPGLYSFSATYSGATSAYLPSTSANEPLNVGTASSMTNVVSNVAPVSGQSTTFTATVSAVLPGTGTPTGPVEFLAAPAGGQPAPITGSAMRGLSSSGTATCTTSALLASGSKYTVTAEYPGDGNFTGSAGNLTETVAKAPTTTAVVSTTGSPSVTGQPVTYTAMVPVTSPGAGSPSGFVEFLDGITPIGACGGTSGTALNGPTATCTVTTYTSTGSHSITAQYLGDPNFLASPASPAITQTVGPAATTTVLAPPPPSKFGAPVTLTAQVQVVAPGTGVPTGTVTFYDGTGVIGTGSLSGGAATVIVSGLPGASQSLKAVYAGNAAFLGSSGTAVNGTTFTQTISGTVSGSLSITSGQLVLITGKVTGAVSVSSGGLEVDGGSIGGAVSASGASALTLCGAKVGGAMSVGASTGYVFIGGGTLCAPSSVSGAVSFSGNKAGLDVTNSSIGGAVSVSGNSGSGTELYGDTIGGALSVSGNTGSGTEIAGNTIGGGLSCSGNSPSPTDAGVPNTAASRSGQCASSKF